MKRIIIFKDETGSYSDLIMDDEDVNRVLYQLIIQGCKILAVEPIVE